MSAKVRLQGATALVTGAGAGIGRETALALAAEGATLVVTDIDLAAAEKVAAEVQERGGQATAHRLDVTDALAVSALAAQLDATTPVDVVVANAGVGMSGRLGAMTLADWDWIRSVNLDGVVHTCHAFGPPMVQRGRGHVVIVSSGLGFTARATEPAYCATKAAVLQLAQCLRADWGSRGVGVSAICPGVINTDIIEHTRFLPDPEIECREAQIGRSTHSISPQVPAQAAARKVFARGHHPDTVARSVVKAITHNRAMAAPGWESKAGWVLHRFAPLALQQCIARKELA